MTSAVLVPNKKTQVMYSNAVFMSGTTAEMEAARDAIDRTLKAIKGRKE